MIPNRALQPETTHEEIIDLALAREEQLSTDLGNGVAFPHARVSGLRAPIIVFGRSDEGIVFSPASSEPVQLMFLVVTSAEQPETQLALLGQLAAFCREASARDALKKAETPADVMAILNAWSREATQPR
jgi:PTS system fructose-specific IIC component